jgi:hypothetical protein
MNRKKISIMQRNKQAALDCFGTDHNDFSHWKGKKRSVKEMGEEAFLIATVKGFPDIKQLLSWKNFDLMIRNYDDPHTEVKAFLPYTFLLRLMTDSDHRISLDKFIQRYPRAALLFEKSGKKVEMFQFKRDLSEIGLVKEMQHIGIPQNMVRAIQSLWITANRDNTTYWSYNKVGPSGNIPALGPDRTSIFVSNKHHNQEVRLEFRDGFLRIYSKDGEVLSETEFIKEAHSFSRKRAFIIQRNELVRAYRWMMNAVFEVPLSQPYGEVFSAAKFLDITVTLGRRYIYLYKGEIEGKKENLIFDLPEEWREVLQGVESQIILTKLNLPSPEGWRLQNAISFVFMHRNPITSEAFSNFEKNNRFKGISAKELFYQLGFIDSRNRVSGIVSGSKLRKDLKDAVPNISDLKIGRIKHFLSKHQHPYEQNIIFYRSGDRSYKRYKSPQLMINEVNPMQVTDVLALKTSVLLDSKEPRTIEFTFSDKGLSKINRVPVSKVRHPYPVRWLYPQKRLSFPILFLSDEASFSPRIASEISGVLAIKGRIMNRLNSAIDLGEFDGESSVIEQLNDLNGFDKYRRDGEKLWVKGPILDGDRDIFFTKLPEADRKDFNKLVAKSNNANAAYFTLPDIKNQKNRQVQIRLNKFSSPFVKFILAPKSDLQHVRFWGVFEEGHVLAIIPQIRKKVFKPISFQVLRDNNGKVLLTKQRFLKKDLAEYNRSKIEIAKFSGDKRNHTNTLQFEANQIPFQWVEH